MLCFPECAAKGSCFLGREFGGDVLFALVAFRGSLNRVAAVPLANATHMGTIMEHIIQFDGIEKGRQNNRPFNVKGCPRDQVSLLGAKQFHYVVFVLPNDTLCIPYTQWLLVRTLSMNFSLCAQCQSNSRDEYFWGSSCPLGKRRDLNLSFLLQLIPSCFELIPMLSHFILIWFVVWNIFCFP